MKKVVKKEEIQKLYDARRVLILEGKKPNLHMVCEIREKNGGNNWKYVDCTLPSCMLDYKVKKVRNKIYLMSEEEDGQYITRYTLTNECNEVLINI